VKSGREVSNTTMRNLALVGEFPQREVVENLARFKQLIEAVTPPPPPVSPMRGRWNSPTTNVERGT
jgi:hypothetical protein